MRQGFSRAKSFTGDRKFDGDGDNNRRQIGGKSVPRRSAPPMKSQPSTKEHFSMKKAGNTYLCGVSVAYRIKHSNWLSIRGWFLSTEPYNKILILHADGRTIGFANMHTSRIDVFEAYPQYNDKNSGWEFSGDAGKNFDGKVVIVFQNDTKEIYSYPYDTPVNPIIDCHIQWLDRNYGLTPVKPGHVPPEYLAQLLTSYKVEIARKKIDISAFNKWVSQIDYSNYYKEYVKEFPKGVLLTAKAFQHFSSLLNAILNKESSCIDIASSHSPFYEIVRRLYGSKTYKQDQRYPSGINGDTIGCNAVNIDMKSCSVDFITLHCSWEHFENDADVMFLYEALRLLKKNGTLWIGPLYMDIEDTVVTSPHCWISKYRTQESLPCFTTRSKIFIDEKACQRQSKFISPRHLAQNIVLPLRRYCDIIVEYYENHSEIPGAHPFSLFITKTADFLP